MHPQPEKECIRRETELREPTGDTVRLPQLGGFKFKISNT